MSLWPAGQTTVPSRLRQGVEEANLLATRHNNLEGPWETPIQTPFTDAITRTQRGQTNPLEDTQ